MSVTPPTVIIVDYDLSVGNSQIKASVTSFFLDFVLSDEHPYA
jgi:hypothetical protein